MLFAALVWLVAAASSVGGLTAAQTPGGGPGPGATGVSSRGAIRGVVSAAGTGQPLAAAEVRLTPTNAAQVRSGQIQFPRARFTRADEHGRYEFTEVEPGRHTVWATKVGFVALYYGQRVPSEAAAHVDLAAGQALDGINIALLRGAVIAVRVVDPYGDPVSGAVVQAFQARLSAPEDKLLDVRPAGLLTATDDRGEMRVFGLAPGEYFLSARPEGQPPTLYPGTISPAEAHVTAVREGEEIGLTIPLVSSRRAAIAGTVIDATGAPAGDAALQLTRYQAGSTAGHPVVVSPDGRFTATNLPPGDYRLRVRSGPRPGGQEFGHVAFRIDEGVDLTDLVVRTKSGATIRGRVIFDEEGLGAQRPAPRSLSIASVLASTGGFPPSHSEVRDDWSFTLANVVGEGVLRVQGPGGWFLKRVVLDGRDVSDSPMDFDEYAAATVEVHLTRRQTRLTGTAVGAAGRPTISYVVVAFAEDRRLWTPQSRFVATARPDQTGRYTLAGLPPGRYRVVALNYLPSGAVRDPRILERLAAPATPLTLAEGEARTMDFQIVERY
jgi:protocatechuate 3,4-dioxygenase beta subunit